MDEIKISIITVSFNCVNTIEKTIQSVLAQDYPLVEYIVIDGGSTDGTKEIIERYSDQLAYWVSEADEGIYNAMNKGLKHATGEIVNFQGGDDWLYSNDILTKISEMMKKEEISVLMGLSDYGGKIKSTFPRDIDDLLVHCPNHQAVFARKSLFQKYGLFNENYKIVADYEWLIKVYTGGEEFKEISDVVCYYSNSGISADDRVYCELLPLRKKEIERLDKMYLWKEICKNAINAIISVGLFDMNFKRLLINTYFPERKCIIWGAGNAGKSCFLFLEKYGIAVEAFVDNNLKLQGSFLEGVKIVSPVRRSEVPIVVASYNYENEIRDELIEQGNAQQKDFYLYSEIKNELFCFWCKKMNCNL